MLLTFTEKLKKVPKTRCFFKITLSNWETRDNNVNIDFLNYTLKNIDIKNKISSGSVIPQLTVPMIQGLKIYVPTLEYQEKIVNKVKNIEREIEILKEQQINLNEEINKIVQTYIN